MVRLKDSFYYVPHLLLKWYVIFKLDLGPKDSGSEEEEQEGDDGENVYDDDKDHKANLLQIIDQLLLEYVSDTVTDERVDCKVALGKIRR